MLKIFKGLFAFSFGMANPLKHCETDSFDAD
jgi:hypothetical protein